MSQPNRKCPFSQDAKCNRNTYNVCNPCNAVNGGNPIVRPEPKCVDVCDPYLKYVTQPNIPLLNQSINYALNGVLFRYIQYRFPTLPDPPFFPQTGDPVYPWNSITIPSEIVNTIPDSPSPPYPPNTPSLPNTDGYDKYKSIGPNFYYFLGYNFFTIPATQPDITLFLTNIANRGPDNFQKKQYMYALRTEIIPLYQEKIDQFLNNVYFLITAKGAPILSTFYNGLLKLILDIHLGSADHPSFTITYLEKFTQLLAYYIEDAQSPAGRETLTYGWQYTPAFKAYIKDRINVIMSTDDTTTLTYWWIKAGMIEDLVQTEIIHNLVAMLQMQHVLYQLLLDKIQGTHFPPYQYYDKTTNQLLPAPSLVIQYNFLDKYATAVDDTERINQVREMMRLTVPNGFSVSHVIGEDYSPNWLFSFHIHQELMVSAYEAEFGPNSYYGYDLTKYAPYDTTFQANCPFIPSGPGIVNDPANYFELSPIDNETVLDKCNPAMMPVYKTLLYTPFGLGNRRCAGEIFNMLFLTNLMGRFVNLNFTTRQPQADYPLIPTAAFLPIPDNFFVA